VTPEERYLIEVVRGARIATDGGIDVCGVAVGSDDFIRGHLRKVVDTTTDSRNYLHLARQIAKLPDKQVALRMLTKCLTSKLTHVARTTNPEHFIREVGVATANINSWLMERIMMLPQTADVSIDDVIAARGGEGTIAMQRHQQLQLTLPLGNGGFGVPSLNHVSPAAYLGASMQNVYRAVVTVVAHHTDVALAAENFSQSPVVHGILASIRLMLAQGVTAVQLAKALPAEWVTAATTDDQPAIVLARHLLSSAVGGTGAISKG
jgi:hypothetical protein